MNAHEVNVESLKLAIDYYRTLADSGGDGICEVSAIPEEVVKTAAVFAQYIINHDPSRRDNYGVVNYGVVVVGPDKAAA